MTADQDKRRRAIGDNHSINVGQSSNKFTYRSSRSVNEAELGRELNKSTNKTKSSWWKHIPTYLSIIVIIVLILYSITLSSQPKVVFVNNSSTEFLQPESTYKADAEKLLSESILNKTKLTINANQLASQFVKEFPEVDKATLVIPLLGHTPVLELGAAQPVFILSGKQGQFVLDQEGVVILKSNNVSDSLGLPIVKDDSGLSVTVSQQVLSNTSVSFITSVIDEFKAKNIPIQSLTLASVPFELDVQPKGQPYYVKFNLLGDARLEAGTYLVALQQLKSTNSTPTQYIDVRVVGRAYYK